MPDIVFSYCSSFSEPSEPPSNITVLPTNASTVIVSWSPPLEEDRNGIIQGYTVRVVGVHTDEDFTLSVSTTAAIVGGLHPFYSYKFRVAAVTILHGPFSNPKTAMMPPFGKSNFKLQSYYNESFLPVSPITSS